MIERKVFIANDGEQFETRGNCLNYENLLTILNRMKTTTGVNDQLTCLGQNQYRQHSMEGVIAYRKGLICAIQEHANITLTDDILVSYCSTTLRDSKYPIYRAIGKAANILSRIDTACREWQQPYYAWNTPEQAQLV